MRTKVVLLVALLAASFAVAQRQRYAETPEEEAELRCARERQRCVDRRMSEIQAERDAVQEQVDRILRDTKFKAVVTLVAAALSKGQTGPVLGIAGSLALNSEQQTKISDARAAGEQKIRAIVASCGGSCAGGGASLAPEQPQRLMLAGISWWAVLLVLMFGLALRGLTKKGGRDV